MKKISLLLLLLIVVLAGIMISQSFFAPRETKLTPETIATAFSHKYNKPVDTYIIEIQTDTGKFAKGSVRMNNEFGGALWFAARTGKGWELAADGQGPMKCEVADTYSFPKELVPSCINGDTLKQR